MKNSVCRPEWACPAPAILKGRPGIVHHPTGDLPRLLRSIRETVLSLPEDTDLLPGHDMPTTVAAERELYL